MAIAERVADCVRVLHETSVDGSESTFRAWETFVQSQLERLYDAHLQESGLREKVCAEMRAFVESTINLTSDEKRLVHADLTEDRLLLMEKDGNRVPPAIIDYADSEVGDVEYEWPVLCLGMFGQDPTMVRAFFEAYDGTRIDEDRRRQMFAWTLMHRFGPGIVNGFLKERGNPEIGKLDELFALMWSEERQANRQVGR